MPDLIRWNDSSGFHEERLPMQPSLGELLKQGKDNLDAWWIIVPTFVVLVLTMLLLTFIGDALRDAFDTRKS